GLEVTRRRGLLQRVEVLACGPEELARAVEVNPAFDLRAARVLVWRFEVEPLAIEALNHVPAVAGRPRLVHDEHGRRALLGALLVLVGPATVVRHRWSAEDRGIELAVGAFDRRIVHEHDER